MSTIAEDEKLLLAGLASCPCLNAVAVRQLLDYCGSAAHIWRMPGRELVAVGVPTKIADGFEVWKKDFDIDTFRGRVLRYGLKLLALGEKDYPKLLQEITDPPMILYIKGELIPDEVCISLVGNRRASGYGIRMTERIARSLAESGVTVVSGLALGVDGVAHKATVDLGGRTVAVLAHGLDCVYPYSHRDLAKKILEQGGALISEYAPGVPSLKHHFLIRNRIIAGMGLGTVVTEAGERSGSLATARLALEYGRTVFAVPGDAEREQAAGVNNLIRQGACPIVSGEQVLDELNLPKVTKAKIDSNLTAEEKMVLGLLGSEPVHVDKLAATAKLGMAKLNALLINLELKGVVRNAGGMRFVRC